MWLPRRLSEASKVQSALDRLRRLHDAFERAQQVQVAGVQALVRASPLPGTTMLWAFAFAKACSWGSVSPQLDDMCRNLFSGFGQSKLVEDCMQRLRDHEHRDAPARLMEEFRAWQIPVDSNLLNEHGFRELVAHGNAATPDGFSCDRLFQPVHGSNGDRDSCNLRAILSQQTWVTWNSKTIRNTFGQTELLLYLHANNCWEEASAAWHAWLLPEGHLIFDKSDNYAGLVVKVVEWAALTWRAQREAEDMWTLDRNAEALDWRVVFGASSVEVMNSELLSPLHARLLQWSSPAAPIWRVSGSRPLLDFHRSRGYTGVPEMALRELADTLGVEAPAAGDFESATTSDVFALSMMRYQDPELDEAEATSILLQRRDANDTKSGSYLDDLTEDMVLDVCVVGDQRDMQGYLKEYTKLKSERQGRRAAVVNLVKKVLAKAASASKAVALATKKQEVTLAKQRAAEKQRFDADLESSAADFVMKHKPADAKVHVGIANGRFLCVYPQRKPRSYSWTDRGEAKAVQLALRQLWEWHTESTGIVAPALVGDLAREG